MSAIKLRRHDNECLLFFDFISEKEAYGLSKQSIENYKKVYDAFRHQMGQNITQESINKWIHMMINKCMNPISINFYISQIRVFAYWLIKNGYCKEFEIKKIKTQEPQVKTIPDNDVKILLEKPPIKSSFSTYRSWVIINFILGTGARQSTVRNLRVRDIDFDSKEIRYTHLKNKTSAIVPLSPTLERVLRLYLNTWDIGDGYLFPDIHGGFLTGNALEHSLRNYSVLKGVKHKGAHSLRHTFAKKFILAGGNALILQRLLTHTDLAMTKKYVRLFNDDLHNNYENLCPLDSYQSERLIKKKRN